MSGTTPTHAPLFVCENGDVLVPKERVTTRNGYPELEYRTQPGVFQTFNEIMEADQLHARVREQLNW